MRYIQPIIIILLIPCCILFGYWSFGGTIADIPNITDSSLKKGLFLGVFLAAILLLLLTESPSTITQRVRKNVRIFTPALIFLLLAILFFLLQHLLSKPETFTCDPLTNSFQATTTSFSWAYICNLLGSSLLITSVFSVTLGFTDFINYVVRQLRNIVVSHDFTKRLSVDEKKALRITLDRDLYGKSVTNDQYGLYHFLTGQLERILDTPYREDFHDSYKYSEGKNEAYWECFNSTSYNLCFEHLSSTRTSFPVRFGETTFIEHPEELTLQEYFIDFFISIDTYSYKLSHHDDKNPDSKWNEKISLNIPHHLSIPIHNADKEKEKSKNKEKKSKWLPDEIPLSVIARRQGNKIVLEHEITINIDRSKTPKTKIEVVFSGTRLSLKKDTNIYCIMNCPTKDAYFECSIVSPKNSFCFSGAAFTLKDEFVHQQEGENFCFVQVREWMFAGHGALIHWCLPPEKIKGECLTSQSSMIK